MTVVTKDVPTLLRLEGMGVPRYSARGLTQSLRPIQASQHIERTINGGLIDLSYTPMQKYASTISGNDQRPPAVEGVWPGKIVWVDCIAELCKEGEDANFERPIVDYDAVRIEAGFIFYRPRLLMMVLNWTMDEDEWARGVNWSLELEEV